MKAVFIDIESTGLDFNIHVPIDIAVIIVDYSRNEERFTYSSCITCYAEEFEKADTKALQVNGFNLDCIWNGKPKKQVGLEIEEFLVKHEIIHGKAFFICQNPSYDRPFFTQLISHQRMHELNMPYHWLDLASMYWIKFFGSCPNIPSKEISLSKDSIADAFNIPPEKKPHKALNGAEHLLLCYERVRRYGGFLYSFDPILSVCNA